MILPLFSNGPTSPRSTSRLHSALTAPAKSSWTTTACRYSHGRKAEENCASSSALSRSRAASMYRFVSRTKRLTPPHPPRRRHPGSPHFRSEEHTSELQSRENLVCRLLLEKT